MNNEYNEQSGKSPAAPAYLLTISRLRYLLNNSQEFKKVEKLDEIKNEIQKKGPNIEQLKENVEKINREGAEWEKKSKELRESLPSQEDFPSELPSL